MVQGFLWRGVPKREAEPCALMRVLKAGSAGTRPCPRISAYSPRAASSSPQSRHALMTALCVACRARGGDIQDSGLSLRASGFVGLQGMRVANR